MEKSRPTTRAPQASKTWDRLEDFVRAHVHRFLTAVIWKRLQVAESTFRRLKGAELLPAVYAGAQYVDGRQRITSTPQRIAD